MDRETLSALKDCVAARRPVAHLTWLDSGEQRLIAQQDLAAEPSDLGSILADGFRTDRSRTLDIVGREAFVRIYNPPLRLMMIGAVHISQALIDVARAAGYAPIVIDPRTAFATADRFAGVDLDARWPDDAIPEHGLDARTAFVALTHDPKIDDPALTLALQSDVFYIGALGSRRTHAKRVERLTAQGISDDALARISAPIGLDIGAIGPVEIAIAIIAEITAALRGRLDRAR